MCLFRVTIRDEHRTDEQRLDDFHRSSLGCLAWVVGVLVLAGVLDLVGAL